MSLFVKRRNWFSIKESKQLLNVHLWYDHSLANILWYYENNIIIGLDLYFNSTMTNAIIKYYTIIFLKVLN